MFSAWLPNLTMILLYHTKQGNDADGETTMRQKLQLNIPTQNENVQQLVAAGYTANTFGAINNQDVLVNDGFLQDERGKAIATLFNLINDNGSTGRLIVHRNGTMVFDTHSK